MQYSEITSNKIHDKIADDYIYDIQYSNSTASLKHQLIKKYINSDHTVLDLGCGNGLHMRLLANKCQKIIGVDINEKMLALAKKKLEMEGIKNFSLCQEGIEKANFVEESFDIVYSFSTLLLIFNIDQAITSIAKLLKRGGYAVLDITGRYNLSQIHWTKWYRANGHFGLQTFTYPLIIQKLKDQGLEVVESHALGLCEQWKYIPIINRFKFLDKIFHNAASEDEFDLDYKISNWPLFFPLANRWYLVCRKK